MPVVWRATAIADIERIVAFIAEQNPLAAVRVGRAVILAVDSLAVFPRRGRPGAEGGTRELLAVFPYVLLYRVTDNETITVFRVWHGAQDRR